MLKPFKVYGVTGLLHYMDGSYGKEWQIGPLVIYRAHRATEGGRWSCDRDPYWRWAR